MHAVIHLTPIIDLNLFSSKWYIYLLFVEFSPELYHITWVSECDVNGKFLLDISQFGRVNSETLASGPPFLGLSSSVYSTHSHLHLAYQMQTQMKSPCQCTQIITSGWSHSGDDKNLSVTHFKDSHAHHSQYTYSTSLCITRRLTVTEKRPQLYTCYLTCIRGTAVFWHIY